MIRPAHHNPAVREGGAMARLAAVAAVAGAIVCGPAARAQVLLDKLPELENVGIVEKRGDPVPRDLEFTDSRGRRVTMGDFFDGRRPVILVMAYYTCPLQCVMVLNSVQRCLNELKWTAGEEFRVVTVSFDHRDTTERAREKQLAYLSGYAREAPESAWSFLTGRPAEIRALANAVGYHYRFFLESGQFSHPAAIIFLTPEGRVSNYLEKIEFPAPEVRMALADAADGRIGSIFERVVLFCFHYDPKTGQHTLAAVRVMRVAGALTAGVLGVSIGYFAWSRSRRAAPAPAPPGGGGSRSRNRGGLVPRLSPSTGNDPAWQEDRFR